MSNVPGCTIRTRPGSTRGADDLAVALGVLVHDVGLVQELAVSPVDGVYEYTFERVPFGEYSIVAGTDLDNDGVLCHGGEACGQYPTIQLFQTVSVESDREGLDFGTGFQQAKSSSSPSDPSATFTGLLQVDPSCRAIQIPTSGCFSRVPPNHAATSPFFVSAMVEAWHCGVGLSLKV